MADRFDTMRLPGVPDVAAPDGSDVRVLLQLDRGGMAHFELGAGRTSVAVAHHSVDEIWYILRGHGEMWRRQGDRRETGLLGTGNRVSNSPRARLPLPGPAAGPLSARGLAEAAPGRPDEDAAV